MLKEFIISVRVPPPAPTQITVKQRPILQAVRHACQIITSEISNSETVNELSGHSVLVHNGPAKSGYNKSVFIRDSS